ncbi:unnamed protein product [Blepharisma stoltei]|uniref:Purple acid phosphatase n=1 Tax=Blepharisma stoltei TaxID=1481888 RepID=A0AAU9JW46_9CILI|nr:unnamed protein product [Blepharisma stoltei]
MCKLNYFISLSLVLGTLFQPEQIHLSWTENENEMRATWVNFLNLETFIRYRPILCSDIIPDWLSAPSSCTPFNAGEIIYRLQYIYTSVIPNLRPECFYEYFIETSMTQSEIYMFSGRTPDASEPYQDAKNPLSMVVYGDLGIGKNSLFVKNSLMQEIKVRDFLGIIHMGDIAYDMHEDDGMVGDRFLNSIQDISANFAYMVLPGNHELKHNLTHYRTKFKMPLNSANDGTSFFYSFNLGAAHFIMINTEMYISDHPDQILTQYNWLKKDLEIANQNRQAFPWIFVFTHRPLYCSLIEFSECTSEAEILKSALEGLWHEYAVDIMFEAHNHYYERCTPIYKDRVVKSEYDDFNTHYNANATLYIISGNGGNNEGHNDPIPEVWQDWTLVMTDEYGYGKLDVLNKTHVHWTQYGAVSGDMVDHVWLIKNRLRFY